MLQRVPFGDRDVLVVVDIQNDFCPGGNRPCRAGTRWSL